MDRYTVISADCHGGGAILDYRPYLPSALHDDFDSWLAEFDNPYDDLEGDEAARNWDADRRLRELEDDGIVAFHDIPVDETQRMLGLNAAEFYGFDVDALRPLADQVGPTPDELGQTDQDANKWDALRAAGRPWLTGAEA